MWKSRSDLDLGLTMPNIELVRDIFVYYNVIQFDIPTSIVFELSCKNTETETHIHTPTHTPTHTHQHTDTHTHRL